MSQLRRVPFYCPAAPRVVRGNPATESTLRQRMITSTPQEVTGAYLVVLLYSSKASGWNLESTPFFKLILRCFKMIWPRIE